MTKDEILTPSALNEFFRAIFEHLNLSFLRRRQLELRMTELNEIATSSNQRTVGLLAMTEKISHFHLHLIGLLDCFDEL